MWKILVAAIFLAGCATKPVFTPPDYSQVECNLKPHRIGTVTTTMSHGTQSATVIIK
jgi:hypothetical protein